MASRGGENEYNQYAPQTSGRLFSNSMMGFNKEEVLEYLEEMAHENYQRQESADQQIQDLLSKIQNLENNASKANSSASSEEVNALRQKMNSLASDLDIAKTASQQAEGELQEFKEHLYNAQRENEWLREESQKNDRQIAELRRQLDEASSGQWQGAEGQIAELRRQLAEAEAERDAAEAERDAAEAERDAAEAERDAYLEEGETIESPAMQASGVILAEATEEADRIRADAYADRDRVHRQILNSAGGLADSIGTLKEDISSVEGDVSGVLEAVQEALAELIVSLNRTEQNLLTLGIQAERFPASSPSVPKSQVVYFQPAPLSNLQSETPAPSVEAQKKAPDEAPARPAKQPSVPRSYGSSGFKAIPSDISESNSKLKPFRPTYSTSPSAQSPYWPQTAKAFPPLEEEVPAEDERVRKLSETLAKALLEIMN